MIIDFEQLEKFLPLIGGGGILGILAAARRAWLNARRSRLRRAGIFDLPQAPELTSIYLRDFPDLGRHLVGRDREVAALTRLVQENPLVFVNGPSGVGKSTLLRLGVARRLMQTGSWLPVYVDIWGLDWVDGPRLSLADALQVAMQEGLDQETRQRVELEGTVTPENLWQCLDDLRGRSGRRPVLIFDQIDDYQNRHRDLMTSEDGALISTSTLIERNTFWRQISRLSRSGAAHVLFVVRSDAAIFLDPLRFSEPKSFSVARLEAEDVSALIDNLIRDDAVQRPENGFERLRERIAEQLSKYGPEDGVLPIQMRVVLSGIAALPRLTPTDLERAGGIEGLESAYITKHVRKAPGGSSLSLRILQALVARRPSNAPGGSPLSRLAGESGCTTGDALAVVEFLERAQITRRRLDPSSRGEVWQLYHEYLARAVIRLAQEGREAETLLAEKASAFRAATRLSARVRALLTPRDQLRLFRERLRGRLIYGRHRLFALASLPRVVLTAPVVVLLLVLAGAFQIVQQGRERVAERRLADAQFALRKHDIGGAVRGFAAAIDNLPNSDPRAVSALAAIVANLDSVPRVLGRFGPTRSAVLSPETDRVLVRRPDGRVEVYEGSTGRKLLAPEIGMIYNDFQFMNFMLPDFLQLSGDGSLATLVFPAGPFAPNERKRPWGFSLAVWRPGSNKLLWNADYASDVQVSHGPRGYLMVEGQQDEAPEILRVRQDVERVRLTEGSIVLAFPPTNEPYIAWATSRGRKAIVALVDVDRIHAGHDGPIPEEAIVWAHDAPDTDYRYAAWQGLPGRPAFIYRYDQINPWYCDGSSCREINSDHSIVRYAEAPTTGTGEIDYTAHEQLERAWAELRQGARGTRYSSRFRDFMWAKGPESISFFRSGMFDASCISTGADQPTRWLGESVVDVAWDRRGARFWAVNADGDLLAVPIRGECGESTLSRRGDVAFSRTGDRAITEIAPSCDGRAINTIRLTTLPLKPDARGKILWERAIPSGAHARFAADDRFVIAESSHVGHQLEARGEVIVLDAQTGATVDGPFGTSGWILQGDAWINGNKRLAAVSKFSGGAQVFAVCEWSGSTLLACSEPLDTLGRISRDGKYFVLRGPYMTGVYSAIELEPHPRPILEVSGTKARDKFNRALMEHLVLTPDSLSISSNPGSAEMIAGRGVTTFTVTCSTTGLFEIRVNGRQLRYPDHAFDQKVDARPWGPEFDVSLSSDGRRIAVTADTSGEVWDVEEGIVLAVMPMPTASYPSWVNPVAFSADGDELLQLTHSGAIDLLRFGPTNPPPPSWASEAAMSAWTQGNATGAWRTAEDVRRAIQAAAKNGDGLSRVVDRSLARAWGRD